METFIPLITSRSFEMIIGIFAILKAGAAYIPIDNSMPVDRIMTIVSESQSKTALIHFDTNDEVLKSVSVLNSVVLLNDTLLNTHFNRVLPSRLIQGTDPVYVVFTSGSTGKPKGVVVSHLWLVNHSTVQFPTEYMVECKWGSIVSIN
jgi:non-ribosomal peptide synthetase component F